MLKDSIVKHDATDYVKRPRKAIPTDMYVVSFYSLAL